MTFTISATSGTIRPVTVSYSMRGKATFGIDYTLSNNLGQSGQVTIPVRQDSISVTLTAMVDHAKENKQKAVMSLKPGSGSTLVTNGKKKKRKNPSAKITVVDSP